MPTKNGLNTHPIETHKMDYSGLVPELLLCALPSFVVTLLYDNDVYLKKALLFRYDHCDSLIQVCLLIDFSN